MEGEDSTGGTGSVAEQLPSREQLASLAVFGNTLLLDKIFTFAIHDRDSDGEIGGVNFTTVHSLRAVQKIWNEEVVRLLYRMSVPLFTIRPQFHNYRHNYEEDAAHLTRFAKSVHQSSGVLGCPPPSQLLLSPEFFQERNRDSLCNFLFSCGTELNFISLEIPMSGGTLKGPLPNLSLPKLEDVTFGFSVCPFNERIRPASENVACLLQSIFNGAPALKTLIVSKIHPRLKIFQRITLPPTLTIIDLPTGVSNEDLELLLLKNNLPNLRELLFSICHLPGADGLVSRILEKYRRTLKLLYLITETTDLNTRRPPFPVHRFRLPIMEKLEKLYMTGYCCDMETEVNPLETHLPKVRVLEFRLDVGNIFNQFVNSSGFASVTHLDLMKEPMGEINADLLAQIHTTFTNLRKLFLHFSRASGLEYIFKEMIKLVDLRLTWSYDEDVPIPEIRESLLLGVPFESLEELRRAPEHLRILPENLAGIPSIRNLKHLRTLRLKVLQYPAEERSLITDLSFQFAFPQMPQLKELAIFGGFLGSPEIIQRWKQDGRILALGPSPQ